MKKILIIYYSQSGQLKQIAENFAKPFAAANCEIEWFEIALEKDFPFPWSEEAFYDAMPECVLGIPSTLKPLNFKSTKYDFIVFAYQPWFLSPSIPATSFLKHPDVKNILQNTPVLTIIGSRNMWVMPQEKIKALLLANGADLVGNIVLEDKNPNLVSAVTIQYWLYTGKKDRFLGIFPKPGVSDEDILSTEKYGEIALDSLINNDLEHLQSKLIEAKAVDIHSNLLFVELRAKVLFSLWANAIIKKKNRTLWINLFKYYLIIALFIVAPIVLSGYTIFFKPFLLKRIKKQKELYLRVK